MKLSKGRQQIIENLISNELTDLKNDVERDLEYEAELWDLNTFFNLENDVEIHEAIEDTFKCRKCGCEELKDSKQQDETVCLSCEMEGENNDRN
jgi:hypothetical protein